MNLSQTWSFLFFVTSLVIAFHTSSLISNIFSSSSLITGTKAKSNPTQDFSVKPRFDSQKIISNWNELGCEVKNLEDLYHPSLEIWKTSERQCHFTSSFFGDVLPYTAPMEGEKNFTKMFNEIYDQFGILSSLRSGKLLSAYRHGGPFGDDFDGDHYIFFPNLNTTRPCLENAIETIATKHHCHLPYGASKSRWFDGYTCNVNCGDFGSHGTCFDANELFLDKEKSENMAQSFGIYLHDALRSLCFSPYGGLWAMVFDSPHIQTMLKTWYGSDFLVPKSGFKGPYYKPSGRDPQNFIMANVNRDNQNYLYVRRSES